MNWQLLPAAQPGRWDLIIHQPDQTIHLGQFDQAQLLAFATQLHSQAEVLRSTQCVLLQRSTMRINNE